MANSTVQPRSPTRGPSSLRFAIAAILVGGAMAILLGEVALRIAAPQWLRVRMEELSLGAPTTFGNQRGWPSFQMPTKSGSIYQLKPSSTFAVTHYEFNVQAHTDRLGGRDVGPLPADPNAKLIPILGDSFTFGVGVKDEETFPALLNNSVCAPRGYRCVNLGLPNTALPGHLDILEARHESLGRPALYLFNVFLGNDYADMIDYEKYHVDSSTPRPATGLAEGPPAAEEVPSLVVRFNTFANQNWLLRRSYTLQLFRATLVQIMNKRRAVPQMDPVFLIMDSKMADYRKQARESLHRSLERAVKVSHDLSFQIALTAIPDKHQVNTALREAKCSYYGVACATMQPDAPLRILREEAKSFGLDVIDTTPCVPGDPSYYFVNDGHMTAKGNLAVAHCIEAAFAARIDALRK